MRIGDINKDNYQTYLQLFGSSNSDVLDRLIGKDGEKKERTEEEILAQLIKTGYLEEGMHVKEGDTSWQKIVPVSDEIKEKIIETVRRQFVTNGNGMGEARDGDEIGAIMKEYRKNIPPSERLAVTWTLSQIEREESVRLVNYVKENQPGWDCGQPFDRNLLLNTNFGTEGLYIRA